MGKIIKVSNLMKNYGPVEAVKNISFEVERGTLFAFLGTNGAGKSTTIDILSTLITKNSGSVVINDWELGKDDQKIRKDIGVVFQNSVLDNLLTVRENLSIRGSFYGLSGSELKNRIKEASKITECGEFIDRRYGKLSGGQKRRADIARALINQPKILFLDEPTTGLDPKTRKSIWNTIGEMQKHIGMTVFLTTHYMEEAANADKITIINHGQIVAEGTPNDLKEKYTKDLLKIYDAGDDVIRYLIEKKIPHKVNKDVVSVIIKTAESAINMLADLRGSITSFEMIHGNMDDVFLKAIGQSQEEAEC